MSTGALLAAITAAVAAGTLIGAGLMLALGELLHRWRHRRRDPDQAAPNDDELEAIWGEPIPVLIPARAPRNGHEGTP